MVRLDLSNFQPVYYRHRRDTESGMLWSVTASVSVELECMDLGAMRVEEDPAQFKERPCGRSGKGTLYKLSFGLPSY